MPETGSGRALPAWWPQKTQAREASRAGRPGAGSASCSAGSEGRQGCGSPVLPPWGGPGAAPQGDALCCTSPADPAPPPSLQLTRAGRGRGLELLALGRAMGGWR